MISTASSSASAPTAERTANRPPSPNQRPGISETALELFNQRLAATKNEGATRKALAIAGFISADVVVCPTCRQPAPRGKFKIHPDGGWKHFTSCGAHGDAVSVLQSVGITTGDAVRVLNGLPTRTEIAVPEDVAAAAAAFVGVKSKIDLDVFNGILVYGRKTGGVQAAQEFYATWHISPDAVEALGAVYITDPQHFATTIQERFGLDRLIECGLFVQTKHGPYCLISEAFPVVEPHRHPATGDVLYMQLRGSHAQHQRYLEHKADPKAFPYKGREKFISLRGAPTSAQIGCGLDLIEKLPAGSAVHLVEGFKDGLAAATMGMHPYAIAGVSTRPTEKICQLLARHTVFVTTDGDEAGRNARDGVDKVDDQGNVIGRSEGLVEYLRRHGVDARPQNIGRPEHELDVTDFLVAGHASGRFNNGTPCTCSTCATMRADHPMWFNAA